MNTNYPKDESKDFIWHVWNIIEDFQDAHPHYWFGWDGFNIIYTLK